MYHAKMPWAFVSFPEQFPSRPTGLLATMRVIPDSCSSFNQRMGLEAQQSTSHGGALLPLIFFNNRASMGVNLEVVDRTDADAHAIQSAGLGAVAGCSGGRAGAESRLT